MSTLTYDYFHNKHGHFWTLTGPLGGVHIWARPVLGAPEKYVGGVEVHYPHPVYPWDSEDKPHHENCWLLGGPCWHDGTSLYFSERIAPMLGTAPFPYSTHEYLKAELLHWYRAKFQKEDDE